MVNNSSGTKKSILASISGGKKKKSIIIIVIAFVGVALLIFGGMSENGLGQKNTDVSGDLEEYEESVKKKIHGICSKVEGVSNVSVAVSFECGFEYVYARENDAGKYLVVGSGSSESAVRVTEIPPVIGGIGIVCKGGGDPVIQKRLINLLSATFGVSSNKIYITEAG